MADQPAIRRGTPAAADPGLVVRPVGGFTVSTGGLTDAELRATPVPVSSVPGTATGTKSAEAAPITVTDVATLLYTGARRELLIQHVSGSVVHLGKSAAVTTASYSIHMLPLKTLNDTGSSDAWYGICDTGLSALVVVLAVT